MNIGIDLDSTLAKIDQPWLDRLNHECGTAYRPEDWSDWNLTFLGEEERKVFFRVFTPDIYKEVLPYPKARDAIQALGKIPGVNLICVTSNPSELFEVFRTAKQQWLANFFPDLADRIVFSRTKSGLGLDVLVDDAPHHLENPDFLPVLVERPWNKGVSCKLHFSEWQEGYSILRNVILNSAKYKI